MHSQLDDLAISDSKTFKYGGSPIPQMMRETGAIFFVNATPQEVMEGCNNVMRSNDAMNMMIANAVRFIKGANAPGTYVTRDMIADMFGETNENIHPVFVLNVRTIMRTFNIVGKDGKLGDQPHICVIAITYPAVLASARPQAYDNPHVKCIAALCRARLFQYANDTLRNNDIDMMRRDGELDPRWSLTTSLAETKAMIQRFIDGPPQ